MQLTSFGSFFRKHDGLHIKRYRCPNCKKTFSDSTPKEIFNQKKPYLNPIILHLHTGGFSQRRSAFVLKVNRKTIVRKFVLMGKKAQKILPLLNQFYPNVKSFEFDDLETFEHTKCKPLSVTMAVEHKSRWIIGFRIASMNAKGPLAKMALKKYGKRIENRKEKRQELFKEIKSVVDEHVHIRSDMNPHYLNDVKEFFPKAEYETHLSRRSAVTGQGELKKIGFDPLFTLNHTYAMLRANINRLFRKTWCTTKKPERLGYHIALYAIYHNMMLINPNKKEAPIKGAKSQQDELRDDKEKHQQLNNLAS